MYRLSFLTTLLIAALYLQSFATTYKINSPGELESIRSNLKPGDSIILANKVWTDFKIHFSGNGTNTSPITLIAETPGKVILAGKSCLNISGNYLVVKGLIFKDGYSPTDAVISFRAPDEKGFATNSRVTECVVDHFNKPVRFSGDNYVALWGSNNRFDHNYLGGKTTSGVTLEVYLFGAEHQKNNHRIDHNYFGPRPRLGSNGGETMRVGSSEVSKSSSLTLIENNYYEHCNGETEVISIKSSDNIIRNNTLYECEGGLVLRHGDRNTVAGNFFIGNGKAETGGVRVINEGHKVYNNYFSDLRGKDFRGPLVLMDGVPNSPLIRYHQVNNVEIAGNVWINCEMPWQFGYPFRFRGNETVRVPPINTTLAYNVIYNNTQTPVITTFDDISGISFKNNYTNRPQETLAKQGMITSSLKLVKQNGLAQLSGLPDELLNITKDYPFTGTKGNVLPVFQLASTRASKQNTGPDWYRPSAEKKTVARILPVKPGHNTLHLAVKKSIKGDIIQLTNAGNYTLDSELIIPHQLKFVAAKMLKSKPVVKATDTFSGTTLVRIVQGGSLSIDGISFVSPEKSTAINAIATDTKKMSTAYKLFVNNSTFSGFKGAVITGGKGTFADTVLVKNSTFKNSQSGLVFNEEKENQGIYDAEYVIINNAVFSNIARTALDLYRGGTDESTFGPFLEINHSVFNNIGIAKTDTVLKLTGVQHVNIRNSVFSNSPTAIIGVLDGRYNKISNSNIYKSGKVEAINEALIDSKTMSSTKPAYVLKAGFKR